MRSLTDRARSDASRWIELAETLVALDTGPGDIDGAHRICALLADQWRKVGFSVEVTTTEPPIVIACRSASINTGLRIVMLGHYDTVFPFGTAQARPLRIESGRAFGAGAADMKLGLVTQLAAVSLVGAASRYDVTAVINGDEESGSVASREIIEREADGTQGVLVFEPPRVSCTLRYVGEACWPSRVLA